MNNMIFVLNKDFKTILTLNLGISDLCYFDDVYNASLSTGTSTFKFSTLLNNQTGEAIVGGNYIAFRDDNNKVKVLQIMSVEQVSSSTPCLNAYCESLGMELLNQVLRARKIQPCNIKQFLSIALYETDWSLGYIDDRLIDVVTISDIDKDINVFKLIQQEITKFNCDIDFSVEIINGYIKKSVNVYKKKGKLYKTRLEVQRNTEEIVRTEDLTNLATALIGRGNNNLKFNDVELEGIDKPIGQDFVYDIEAFERYNINGNHLFRIFEYDTDNPYELLRKTQEALETYCKPEIKYEIKADLFSGLSNEDFYMLEEGDTFYITDYNFSPPLFLEARVSELYKSRTNPSDNKVVFSNFKELKSNISNVYSNSLYTWIMYADDENGNGISNTSTNKKYIGIAYNKKNPNQSDNSKDYVWSLIKGEDGATGPQGPKGPQGPIGATGPQGPAGANGQDANLLDWVKEWDGSKTTIKNTTILSPKIFAGKKESNGTPTGVAMGVNIFGTGSNYSGLAGYKSGINTFLLGTDGSFRAGIESGSHIKFDSATGKFAINADSIIIGGSNVATTTTVNNVVSNKIDNAINNMHIGTRNYILKSSDQYKTLTFSGWQTDISSRTLDSMGLKAGDIVTFRFYVKTGANEILAMLKFGADNGSYTEVSSISSLNLAGINTVLANAEGYLTVTCEIPSVSVATGNTTTNPIGQPITNVTFRIRHRTNTLTSTVQYKEAKFEKGNKPSDWTPAPEDVDSSISAIEAKITEDAITNTVKKNFYTKSETDSQITSKGYQTSSQVQQMVDKFEAKFEESGGYNLIINSALKNGTKHWFAMRWGNEPIGTNGIQVRKVGDQYTLTNRNSLNAFVTGLVSDNANKPLRAGFDSSKFKVRGNTTYTLHCLMACHRAKSITIEMLCYDSSGNRLSGNNSVDVSNLKTGGRDRNNWTVVKHIFTTQANASECHIRAYMNEWTGHETSAHMWMAEPIIVEGNKDVIWTPSADEVYDGITTIDKDGITITNTSSATFTQIDSESFRVEDNNGGTVAEFSRESSIPKLTAGSITANEVYAGNICSKSPKAGDIKFIYVNGSTGNDNNAGTNSSPYKTVQRAIDDIKDKQDQSVTIYVYNSVPGFDLKGITGTGVITLSFQDSAVINGYVILGGVTNSIRITNESGSLKSTFKNGISIYRCVNVDIYGVTFRGTNAQGGNITIQDTNYCAVNSCDFGGTNTKIPWAINVKASLLWLHGCRGSNITDVVAQGAFSHVMMARAGTSNVPDYTNGLLINYDGAGRIQNWVGGTFTKTPSSGWNPAYTPTQKTQTWSFNKIWSDETLNGWSDRQELIQGYASTWNTGRWTGYMQFTDGMSAIRSAISGGTNFSGRLYIQRRTSSGNSTGSKLCLYASDGTLITNSTTINRGQGVWVTLNSSIISKIASGAITYFYLKADANNTATFFKCEANPKIEITYTK